jgi:hypothetical protein
MDPSSRVIRAVVAAGGIAAWLLIPLLSLRANLQLNSRGQLTSGDPTRYLATSFIMGLVLAAIVLSSYAGFFRLIRDAATTYATGIALLALTALWMVLWQTTDDGQAGIALLWILPSGWAAVALGSIVQSRRERSRSH